LVGGRWQNQLPVSQVGLAVCFFGSRNAAQPAIFFASIHLLIGASIIKSDVDPGLGESGKNYMEIGTRPVPRGKYAGVECRGRQTDFALGGSNAETQTWKKQSASLGD
jgi:hypothetical protein